MNYLLFRLVEKVDADNEEDERYSLSWSRHDVWSEHGAITRRQAEELLEEIKTALDVAAQPKRTMDYEDLGLTNPDDIPF